MERLLNHLRRDSPSILVGGILVLIVLLLFLGSYSRWLDIYELDTLDFRFRLRPPIHRTDQAVIIEIGNDTITQLGHFPIDRTYHASLIKALADAGAKAIVFDMFFSEPQPGDEELAEAIQYAGNVYLPFVFDIEQTGKGRNVTAARFTAQTLLTLTQYAKGTGHINIIPDRDGKFRRVPLYIEYEKKFYPYLSFLVGCHILGIPFEAVTIRAGEYMNYGKDFRWPLDEHSTMIINFSGKWTQTYAHYSYVDVLRSYIAQFSGEKGPLDLSVFKDKVCFIGLTAEGTADLHPNPLEPLYPSVGIHAEVLNAMMNKAFVVRVVRPVNLIFLFVLFLLTTIAVWWTRPLKAFILIVSILTIFILLGIFLFNIGGLWIDLFYPTVCVFVIYLLCVSGKSVMEWKRHLILENELKVARQIQESFLPKTLPQTSHLEIAAKMLTAREVGGDLYDYLEFEDGKVGVMIGDVTGKGMPASLLMAMAVSSFRFFALPTVFPKDTLRHLNEKLIKDSSSGLFVTLFYAVFDMTEKTLHYANGGHLPLLYVSKGGLPKFLDVKNGLPLGMMEGEYSGDRCPFGKGDIFVFYTDGITEARNADGEFYEKGRLGDLLQKHSTRPVNELMKIIEDDVRHFEPAHRQHDDITYIVLKVV